MKNILIHSFIFLSSITFISVLLYAYVPYPADPLMMIKIEEANDLVYAKPMMVSDSIAQGALISCIDKLCLVNDNGKGETFSHGNTDFDDCIIVEDNFQRYFGRRKVMHIITGSEHIEDGDAICAWAPLTAK